MSDRDHGLEPNQLNAVFHALSDDRRRDMVARLSRQAMTVSELAEPVAMRLPSAVKHLAVLEAGGLVISSKVGRVRTYRIKPKAFSAIARWIEQRQTAMNAGFDRLEQAIADFPEDDNA
jgi:DNA-binding transcriptional ArsR family regulator